jgi:hypothetical protein
MKNVFLFHPKRNLLIMKQSLLLIFSSMVLFACSGDESKQVEAKTDSAAKKEPLSYPFTAKYSLNWQPGDEQNAVVALNSLKKYVDGDVKGSFEYAADSIIYIADKFYFKGTKDSLEALMTPMRAQLISMSFQPDTWLTAYYPEKKDTWVTIWGVQKWTDKKGKIDSFYLTDDIRVKDGKILEIDEKMRLYPEPRKKK